jgi:hypothetical protein
MERIDRDTWRTDNGDEVRAQGLRLTVEFGEKTKAEVLCAVEAVRAENDRLRELARRNWFIALSERDALRIHGVNPDDGAYITALDETIDEARATMQELGIEVE